jgi:hypothetical protein
MVYDLQRSYDGVSFTPIYARGSVTGKGPATFTFSDITATGGTIFYRVEAISNNSSFSFFSKTVSVRLNIDISSNGVNLYPNPLRGNSFVIHVPTSMHGSYDLKIIDVSGRIADIPLFSADGPVIKVTLRNKLGAGIYSARLSNPNSKESFYYRLVVL